MNSGTNNIFELIHVGASLATILTVAVVFFKASKWFGKWEQLHKDYPPHKHLNGKIAYPKGYKPDKLDDQVVEGDH